MMFLVFYTPVLDQQLYRHLTSRSASGKNEIAMLPFLWMTGL
jgi:hypothetical protein